MKNVQIEAVELSTAALNDNAGPKVFWNKCRVKAALHWSIQSKSNQSRPIILLGDSWAILDPWDTKEDRGQPWTSDHSNEVIDLVRLTSKSGWWFQPLWKIWVSWDDYSQYMESHKIHVPNHQSEMVLRNGPNFLRLHDSWISANLQNGDLKGFGSAGLSQARSM